MTEGGHLRWDSGDYVLELAPGCHVDPLVAIDPSDRLVAAHAAYRFLDDFHKGRSAPLSV